MQEHHVAHYNLAGKRSDAVVSDLKFTDVFEGGDLRDFSNDILILHAFIAKLDCPAVTIDPHMLPIIILRVVLTILMLVYL